MKLSKITSLLMGAVLFVAACTSTQITTYGPLVAQIANEQIVKAVLRNNPKEETKLLQFATVLKTVTDAAAKGTEVTDVLISAFVDKEAVKLAFTPAETQLIKQGLLDTKRAYLDSTKLGSIHIGDPNLQPWIDSVVNGIQGGVAAYHSLSSLSIVTLIVATI